MSRSKKFVVLAAALVSLALLLSPPVSASYTVTDVGIFSDNNIHFHPDSAGKYDTDNVYATDNGRTIIREIELPEMEYPVSITGYVEVHPVPKDELVVCDKWDRAGNVRLITGDGAEIELVKFITAYGGETSYEVDLSHLQTLLRGECKIAGFIDTWVSPAWTIVFYLRYEMIDGDEVVPKWAQALTYIPSFSTASENNGGVTVAAKIPEGLERVKLFYLVSGHCTDGRDADEFVSKDNVIRVDETVVYRYQPWRDDCREVREINPYTRRWSDGYWSSDYSRSGWCPGLKVEPLVLDLTDHLTPGEHKIRFMIENVRPKNEAGDYGYWRVSAYLVGW